MNKSEGNLQCRPSPALFEPGGGLSADAFQFEDGEAYQFEDGEQKEFD